MCDTYGRWIRWKGNCIQNGKSWLAGGVERQSWITVLKTNGTASEDFDSHVCCCLVAIVHSLAGAIKRTLNLPFSGNSSI